MKLRVGESQTVKSVGFFEVITEEAEHATRSLIPHVVDFTIGNIKGFEIFPDVGLCPER